MLVGSAIQLQPYQHIDSPGGKTNGRKHTGEDFSSLRSFLFPLQFLILMPVPAYSIIVSWGASLMAKKDRLSF